jgi:hypothetical protein
MPRENVHFQYVRYLFRITDGNRAEVCGELPPLQGDETTCDRCSLLSWWQSTTKVHSTKTEWNIDDMRFSYVVLIWVADRVPADSLLKISMFEFYKSWKLSHGLRFEPSLSFSRFMPRRCISIEPLLSTWKADISNGFLIFLMVIMTWEQNDWRVPDSFSMACRHKRDAIFEIELQEMRHGSMLTWIQGRFGFRLTQNYQSVPKWQLQAKAHADRFLENSRDCTLLPAHKR